LWSPVRAQLSYSVEIGFLYNTILADDYPGDFTSYYNHASGLNLGFNINNQHNTSINFQFSYSNFNYDRKSNLFNNFFDKKNTILYNIAVRFRTYLSSNKFRPFFLIGPGVHYLHWGKVYSDDEIRKIHELYRPVDFSAPNGDFDSDFYFAIGGGVELELSEKFDMILDGALSLSKSYFLLPLTMNLKYKF